MEQNPYQPPEAPLGDGTETRSIRNEGSLERALAGNYRVSISETLEEAWRMVRGNKGVLMLGLLLVGIAQVGASFLLTSLGVDNGQGDISAGNFLGGYGKSLILGLLMLPLTAPLTAGIFMLAIKRARGLNTGVGEIGAYFGQLPKLLLISIMSTAVIYVGLALFILPGIYLSIAYLFAVPLMIDKNLSPWQSLESSRKAVTHHWFPVFGAMMVLYILSMLLTLTLIGMFWGLPMLMLGIGILYRTIFGFEGEERA